MRPIEPSAAGAVDYVTPILNLLTNVREMEHNLKKRTYSYGLMVVGRPLEELTIPQRMLRAALMPSKYYEEVTSSMAKAINNIVINKQPNSNRRQSKSKYRPVTGKSQIDWTDVLVRLISIAASSLPTPIVKSWWVKGVQLYITWLFYLGKGIFGRILRQRFLSTAFSLLLYTVSFRKEEFSIQIHLILHLISHRKFSRLSDKLWMHPLLLLLENLQTLQQQPHKHREQSHFPPNSVIYCSFLLESSSLSIFLFSLSLSFSPSFKPLCVLPLLYSFSTVVVHIMLWVLKSISKS